MRNFMVWRRDLVRFWNGIFSSCGMELARVLSPPLNLKVWSYTQLHLINLFAKKFQPVLCFSNFFWATDNLWIKSAPLSALLASYHGSGIVPDLRICFEMTYSFFWSIKKRLNLKILMASKGVLSPKGLFTDKWYHGLNGLGNQNLYLPKLTAIFSKRPNSLNM